MMMKKPLIGLTTYGRDEKNAFSLPAQYLESVRRAGAVPFLIAPDETELDEILPMLSGLILTGGGDMNPESYHGDSHETIYMIDDERDQAEINIFNRFYETGRPILGICRGMQIINVAWGGDLIAHLPDQFGETVLHRAPPRVPTPHKVKLDPDSRLAQLLEVSEAEISSWHHQALNRVADPWKVVAHAPDGVIEAVECHQHPWLYAVQWHPELTAAEDPSQQRLFDKLVTASQEMSNSTQIAA